MNANDIELALRARAAFNDSVERIDAGTRTRLRELRLHAQQGGTAHPRQRWAWPVGAALAAALVLAVFLPPAPRAPPAVKANPVAVAPARVIASASSDIVEVAKPDASDAAVETADPDMLSDLEFYGWLAKQQPSGGTGG